MQVDKVRTAPSGDIWFRRLLSEFAQLRWQAALAASEHKQHNLLPVVVTASTSFVNASFHETASCNAEVHSIKMRPLEVPELQHIIQNLCARLNVPGSPDISQFHLLLEPLLPWLSGTPRLLAWLLCGVSGRAWTSFKDQKPAVGTLQHLLQQIELLLMIQYSQQIVIPMPIAGVHHRV